jgi:uncharacterized protein
MIRLTILLLTFSVFASGQDSVLVRETCKKINGLKNPDDIMEQVNLVSGQLMTYVPTIENTPKEKRVKAVYTFQYRLHRELKRTCPKYLIDQAPKIAHRVIDFEDKLTRPEIDSLTDLCVELSKSKKIFVYIVTIDDYFPDKDITDFSNRNREYWGQRGSFEKGNVMIAVSTAQRQIRVSTSDISMEFLTDEECSKINKVIIPYFKEGKYFDGLVSGLSEMKKSL